MKINTFEVVIVPPSGYKQVLNIRGASCVKIEHRNGRSFLTFLQGNYTTIQHVTVGQQSSFMLTYYDDQGNIAALPAR